MSAYSLPIALCSSAAHLWGLHMQQRPQEACASIEGCLFWPWHLHARGDHGFGSAGNPEHAVASVQEQQIRARAGMKQLSKRMTEQRLQALQRLRQNMGIIASGGGTRDGGARSGNRGGEANVGRVRILPRDMEQGLKEFASGVEQLVDKLVRDHMHARLCILLARSGCGL